MRAHLSTPCTKLGDLHVKLVDLHWLVITSDDRAVFQGTATIDASGAIQPIEVQAYDGDNLGVDDTLQLRIWASADSPFFTAHRYQLTGPLDGGKIQIHR